ncbi:MAG: deoxyguanosinetriphosphate triphosphohydrolase [Syntrophorhabdaceae bacterium]|nr:deoxyguanosinetriphosphate triphosphohydrolase [Syntrophorhabdaceae bacterium]
MTIRERLEEREFLTLSPYAQLSRHSRGRLREEPECDIRPAFQHDRDRIIHSKSFRRLKHKTQVFLAPTGDHYRTRLTHTLEVSQIARTIAKSLGLNEDLVEAISLGHDLGHTPFGHAGEEVLNQIHKYGFKHNEQSLRVVDTLEKDGCGLNLTMEVRDGILKHSKGKGEIIIKDKQDKPLTKEAEVVRVADIIAYINHDIDDAITGKVISEKDIPEDCRKFLGTTNSKRIDTMVRGVIKETIESGDMNISFGEELEYYIIKLRDFLYERVYDTDIVHGDFLKCSRIITDLYEYFLKHPDAFLKETKKTEFYDEEAVCVCDYIASMTDRYAFNLFERLFLPLPWNIPV